MDMGSEGLDSQCVRPSHRVGPARDHICVAKTGWLEEGDPEKVHGILVIDRYEEKRCIES